MMNIIERAKIKWDASSDEYNKWGELGWEEKEALIIAEELTMIDVVNITNIDGNEDGREIDVHNLKTETEYYHLQEKGIKTFEVRKNDRDYKRGDMVYLKEVINGIETGRTLPQKQIIYILHGGQFGIEKGYCVLQLR